MMKISETQHNRRWFFIVFSQLCVEPLFGNDVIFSPPPKDAPGEYAITVSKIPSEDETVDPLMKKAMSALSAVSWAVGHNDVLSVEESRSEEEPKQVTYTITIKK